MQKHKKEQEFAQEIFYKYAQKLRLITKAVLEKPQEDTFGDMNARWSRMEYKILASCSIGNCTIIRDIVAIDMGISFKKLEKYYKKLKIVLLTHIHSLRPFQKRNDKEISS